MTLLRINLNNLDRLGLFVALALFPLLQACPPPPVPPDPADPVVAPERYTFERNNESSVSYPGQTVRLMLWTELKAQISATGKAGYTPSPSLKTDLRRLLDHKYAAGDADVWSQSTGAIPPLEQRYGAIAADKNISGKVNNSLGALDRIYSWVDSIDARVQAGKHGTPDAYVLANGLDLAQMIDKTLMGAMIYDQAVSNYLAGVEMDNNADLQSGSNHTEMEHHWDEAFGYFGAARNYRDFPDDHLAGSANDYAQDINGDQKIDLRSELNFGFARNAGKRDKGADQSTDFTKDIFDAFVEGRHAIASKNTAEVAIQRDLVVLAWEDVIAATVVHYINETIAATDAWMSDPTDANRWQAAKVYAEMLGFTQALAYNANNRFASHQASAETDLGLAPTWPSNSTERDAYVAKLNGVKANIGSAFGFTSAQLNSW